MRTSSASLWAMGFALSLAGAPLAWAQDQPDHRTDAPPVHKDEAHPAMPSHTTVQRGPAPGAGDQAHRTEVRPTEHPVAARGPQRWHSGAHFGGSRVVFSDWGRYSLRAPPGGYEWVQDGDELVLIEIDTGIISDVFVIPG